MNAMHQFAMSKFATSQSRDDAMLEEIDMLQGKVKDLSAVLNHHKTLKAENVRLKAELAAAQKDAERYRWLRDGQYWPAAFYDHDEPEPLRGEELDAAIDKAMEAK